MEDRACINRVVTAIHQQQEAQRLRALAPAHDRVRQGFDLELANTMEKEAHALMTPVEPLQSGLGGEIVPPLHEGLPGLELTLNNSDLLNLGASVQRSNLIERAGVLELGIETAQDSGAKGAVQKMLTHQLAAGHKRAMELLAESNSERDADVAIKKVRASARLMDVFSRTALTLQKLQGGGNQVIQVQHIQVLGQAVIAQAGGGQEKIQNPVVQEIPPQRNKSGRPTTTGYRTNKAVAQRKADRELVVGMNKYIKRD